MKSMEAVLIGRNEACNMFNYREKSIFEKEKLGYTILSEYDSISEAHIVTLIGITNSIYKFYTYNPSNNTYTDVIVVNKNIKSIANNTTDDNILKLPITL